MNQEEMIAIIKDCATKLGRTPKLADLEEMAKIRKRDVQKAFGTYERALEVCGFEIKGAGHRVPVDTLFLEWAGIVRKTGKIPTITEYEKLSGRSLRPMMSRFRSWSKVPVGVLEYLKSQALEGEWRDVAHIICSSPKSKRRRSWTSSHAENLILKAKVHAGQTFYGSPLFTSVVTYSPTNENAVLVMFATMARDMGFTITHIQQGFPDGEVMREVAPGRHQRLRVEFELESRNFVAHGHPVDGCEMIICWEHNWPECPLEVLELKSVVEQMKNYP